MSGRSAVSPAPLNLDVLFSPEGDGFRAQIVRSPVGDGPQVIFPFPCTDSELAAFIQSDYRFRQMSASITDSANLAKAVGGRLFDAVFSGPVLVCLRRSLDRAAESGAALRIRLRLSDCPALVNLPWELLYDRESDSFLALSADTPVIRYVQITASGRATELEPPLRVLAIRSEPRKQSPLKTAAEWASILAALTAIGLRKVQVTELENPSLEDLRRVFARTRTRTPFHVMHYMGHGAFDPSTGGALLFCDERGRAQRATADQLKMLLKDQASLRLVVLNSCEGARTDPADPFAGVADALVRLGIPSVIAMQFEITDRAAVKFTSVLYEMLADSSQVDIALAEARKALAVGYGLEWATPVLYSRADDTRLFDSGEPRDQRDQNGQTHDVAPGRAPGGLDLPGSTPVVGPPRPEISGVFIFGDAGDYRVEVRGSGFGQVAHGLPYRGTMPNFLITVVAQQGAAEWGYAGTGRALTYDSWTDREIITSALAANPGDAIVLALWNDGTGSGACWAGNVPPIPDEGPVIEDVRFSGPAASPIVDIRGSGFGPPPCATPGTVSADHLIISNWRDHPRGSDPANTWTAGVGLRIASWTDDRILISAFTGTFGTGRDVILPGDPLSILYRTQENGQAIAHTAWAGKFAHP